MIEPTRDDIDALIGPATPHFAYQLRARVRELVEDLPEDHPIRKYGEEKMELLDRLGRWGTPVGLLLTGVLETAGQGTRGLGLSVAPAWLIGLVTSLDLVELNPFLDERGKTARLMVDLVASLMGRKVFDRPTRSFG